MFLILDALAAGEGRRLSSLDVIGAGPRAIAGVLEMFGLEYEIYRVEDFLRRGARGFRVLLASAMTMDEPAVKRAASRFRGVKIIGGPITSDPSVVPRLGFHLGVWGEGEVALESLLRNGLSEGEIPSELGSIPNLITGDGTLTRASNLSVEDFRRFQPSVTAIRFYRTVPHYRSSRVYVEVVRSCSNFNRPKIRASKEMCDLCMACYEFDLRKRLVCPQGIPPGCGYCSIPALYGPPKSRDRDSIVEEVRGLAEAGVRRIVLSGADFLEYGREKLVSGPLTHPYEPGPNVDAIEELLREIKGLSREYGFFFEVENVKPCLVNDEVAEVLGRYLRGTPIHIGVETGDPEHADLLGRPCGPQESMEAIKRLKEVGLRPYAYFIHSLPGQNDKTVRMTLKYMELAYKHGAEKITVYKFRPLPGTAFEGYDVVVDRGSKMIAEKAIELNRERKRELLGAVIKVIVAPSVGRGNYAYPLAGGPVVRLKVGRKLKTGKVLEVRITKVLSDRLVEGIPVDRRSS